MSALSMQQTRRPLLFVLLGLLVLAAAGYLIRDHMQPHTTTALSPQKYTYRIEQAAASSAHYTQNTFFGAGGSPGGDNTAYIASLTDYLNSGFKYSFTGSAVTDLTYSYKADAVLHSTFSGKGSSDNSANVWTKRYSLLKPVTGTQKTKALTLSKNIKIPFADYTATAKQFRVAYDVPVSNEVVVTYTVTVSGKANGVPFSNVQTSTVSAPLDQQVYKIAVQYNRTDSKEVVSRRTLHLENIITTYEFPMAVALALLGLGLIVYGFRKQIIKSPYQRELAQIYRYNAGIIVKARRTVSLTHKTIVDLSSFDDLLSIEEETGLPIVANELSSIATRFIIASEDTAYVFTLGASTPEEDWDDDDERDDSSPKPRQSKQPMSPDFKGRPKTITELIPKAPTKIKIKRD